MMRDYKIREQLTNALSSQLVSSTFNINAAGNRLIIICTQSYTNLGSRFDTEEKLSTYIREHEDNILYEAVEKINDFTYVLNIASIQNFGNLSGPNGTIRDKGFVDYMLKIYEPVIRRFMVEAISGSFDKSKFRYYWMGK